ncbi:MAG: class I SAM-dependent methyltransferase [Spirochaetaceae bacterium]
MPITEPFDTHSDQYEQWFATFKGVYDTEVEALRRVIPGEDKTGVEIGAGSGLFASRLGVQYGVEPSGAMLEKARARGIEMKQGAAEKLPYPDESFDYTLMVTAICFLDDMDKAMEEIRRVLKPGGWALFGFVDKDSPLGQVYLQHKDEDIFYRSATFRSATEVISSLQRQGFEVETILQTVFGSIEEITEIQDAQEGHGEGGFVVLRARRR